MKRFPHALASLLVLVPLGTPALAQTTQRASVSTLGVEAGFTCELPATSADGSVVAFQSSTDTLVPGDTNNWIDVFVHDFDTGVTERVSVSSTGAQANSHCTNPTISDDGRYVAFVSAADNLIPDDDNNWSDIFIRDRQTGTTSLVSRDSSGELGEFNSNQPFLSGDGSTIAFVSIAPNFSPVDTNQWDVYVRDLNTGVTELISKDINGEGSNAECKQPSLSYDGRYVAFSSIASDLVPNDTNNFEDVFLYDRVNDSIERVSVSPEGNQSGGPGANQLGARINDDGTKVVFWSIAGNVVPGDSNGANDVFLRDLEADTTIRLSVGPNGEPGTSASMYPFITRDGRYVVFDSWAKNITPGDTGNVFDILLKDLKSGSTKRVSLDMNGEDPNGHSRRPVLSEDGRFVTFESIASDLVPTTDNNWQDIYRYGPIARDPFTDIDLDGLDGPVVLPFGQPATTTISVDTGDFSHQDFDWWVWAEVPGGATFWMLPTLQWIPSATPIPAYTGGLVDITNAPIIAGATLPVGSYRIHFVIDAPDGVLQGTYADVIEFEVQ